jgi:hypothetical protein
LYLHAARLKQMVQSLKNHMANYTRS